MSRTILTSKQRTQTVSNVIFVPIPVPRCETGKCKNTVKCRRKDTCPLFHWLASPQEAEDETP